MEITCPICGELWELRCLHREVVARSGVLPEGCTYDARLKDVREDFQRRGCEALSSASATHRGANISTLHADRRGHAGRSPATGLRP